MPKQKTPDSFTTAVEDDVVLTLELTEEELDLLKRAAAIKKCSVEDFVIRAALKAAQKKLERR